MRRDNTTSNCGHYVCLQCIRAVHAFHLNQHQEPLSKLCQILRMILQKSFKNLGIAFWTIKETARPLTYFLVAKTCSWSILHGINIQAMLPLHANCVKLLLSVISTLPCTCSFAPVLGRKQILGGGKIFGLHWNGKSVWKATCPNKR